jgi:nitroreductase
MDFTKLIQQRESIRNYDPARPVPREVLDRIMEAGRLAPSACNIQPWQFLVIESPALLRAVKACYFKPWFHDAPQILVVVGFRKSAWVRTYDGYNSLETDIAIAFTHLMLAAENEGVGTCWIEAYDPVVLRKALDLKENEEVFGITPLGYPREGFVKKGIKNRKSPGEVVRYL